MKTYTTGQIIDILKPGQKAKMVVEKGGSGILVCNHNGKIVWEHGLEYIWLTQELRNSKWQLLPQYVTFEEALKAYKEGKTVQCEVENDSFTYKLSAGDRHGLCWYEIIRGKWSIVEEDSQ